MAAALPKVARYIKNVGKSIVYASVDNIKEDMPNVAAVVDHESNKEVYKAIYQGIRDYKTTYSRAVRYIKSTKVYEAGTIMTQALGEDIRTGKLYNKERMAQIEEKVGNQMGFGMDDMDNFDVDDNFDFGDSSTDDITEGDRLSAGATMVASMKSAEVISSTIVRSTEAQMKHTEASTNLLYAQNARLFGELRTDIGNFSNRSIQEQMKTNSIMTTMADNQKKFFENTTTTLQEIASYLRESTEMSRNLYGQKQRDSERQNNKITISDIIDSNGVLDLKEYSKLVGKNFKNVLSEKSGGILDMLNMGGEDANLLAMFAANPWGEILKTGLRGAMSKSLRTSMKNLDKTIGGVAATAIARFTNMGKNDDWDANPIFKTIGQILGVNTSVKSTIDPGKFTKGPVPFDGITRATINNAITGYLSRIEAALTGGPVRVYNPQTGRWTTAKGLQKEFDSMAKGAVNSGTGDLADEMASIIYNKKYRAASRSDKKKIEDNFNNFMQALYNKNGDFRFTSWSDYMNWGVDSEDMFKMMVGALKEAGKKNASRINTAGSVMEAKASLNRRMEDLERDGSIYGLLFSGAYDSKDREYKKKYEEAPTTGLAVNVATFKDNKGHDMYFYLQNILDEVYRMRNAVGGGGAIFTNLHYGNGRQFRTLASNIPNDARPTAKKKYLSNEASANTRYMEEIDKFLSEGGNLYDLYEGDKLKAIMENLSEEDRIKVRRELMDSENAFQRAIYRRHFTTEDLNAKREQQNRDPLTGGALNRFKQATLVEKMQMAIGALNAAVAKPSELAEKLVTKADERIYEFFYSADAGEKDENGNDIKGFMQLMSNRLNAQINKMTEFFEKNLFGKIKEKLGINEWGDLIDKLGIRDRAKSIKEGLFGTKDEQGRRSGGIIGDYIQGVKDAIKEVDEKATNWVKDSFKSVLSPVTSKIKGVFSNRNGANIINPDDLDFSSTSAGIYQNGKVYNLNLGSKYKGAIAKANKDSKAIFEAYKNAIGKNTIMGDEDAKRAGMIAKFNSNLLKTVKGIIVSFKAFPMMLKDMQYGKKAYLFDPTNLGGVDPETGSDFLKGLIEYFNQALPINYLTDEEYRNAYRLQTLFINNKINDFMNAKTKALNGLKEFLDTNKAIINYANDLDTVIQMAIDKHQQELQAAAAGTNYNPELYERLNRYKQDKADGKYQELEATRSSLMGRYAGRQSVVTNSRFDPTNSAFSMRDQTDDEKAIEECNKMADKLIRAYKLDDKTATDIRVLLLSLHDSGEDINNLLASKLYDKAAEFGYTDLAIKINRSMTEDYMNRDTSLKDLRVGGARPMTGPSVLFDRSAEILQKIYDLLSSTLTPHGRTEDEPINVNTRTIVGADGLPIISRARESRTRGEDSHQDEPPAGMAAGGGFFKTRGLSALSKGEIYGRGGSYGVVPETGVYDVKAGTTIYPTNKNKAIEIAQEQKAISKFIKSNAAAANADTYTAKDGNTYSKAKLKNGKVIWVYFDDDNVIHTIDPERDKKDNKTILDSDIVQDTINTARSAYGQVKSAYKGVKFDSSKYSGSVDTRNAKQLADEIRKAAPEITVGTALGAAAGLLIGNPMLGAALGGAMTITSASETAKTWLFGEKIIDAEGNDTGKRKGGAIPKSVQDAFAKYAPSVGSHATVGAALGLVTPFGLVGGALLGGAAGFIKSNDDAKLMLFGDATDPNSGIISKNARDKIAKMAPNLAIGALAGIFTGPFGLVGNAVLGSSLGFLSTTEEFKTTILGEPLKIGPNGEEVRVGGLVGVIRDDIIEPIKNWGVNFVEKTQQFLSEQVFKPLADSFQPIVHEIMHLGKGFGKKLEAMFEAAINTQFGKSLGSWLHGFLRPVKGIAGAASSIAGTVARGTILAPVTAISALGTHLRRNQIARGDADYMTAQERLDYRQNAEKSVFGRLGLGIKGDGTLNTLFRKDKSLETDKTLVSLNKKQLDEASETVKVLAASKNFYQKSLNQKSRAISTLLGAYFDGWTLHQMHTLCKKNQWQSVLNLINTAKPKDITKFDENTKRALMEKVDTLMKEYQAAQQAKTATDADRQRAFDKLKELGFTNINEKNLEEIYSGIKQQQDLNKSQDAAKTEDEKTRDNANENTQKIVDELTKIRMAILAGGMSDDDPRKQDFIDKATGKKSNKPKSDNTTATDASSGTEDTSTELTIYDPNAAQNAESDDGDYVQYKMPKSMYIKLMAKMAANKAKTKFGGIFNKFRRADQASTETGIVPYGNTDSNTREYYDSDSNKIRQFKKTLTGWKEIQSKASTDADRNEDQEQEKQAGFFAKAIGKLPFFNKKEEKKEEKKEGIFSKILKGAGKALSFASPLLKVAGGGLALVTGVAAAGHLGNFLETKAVPFVKEKVAPWLEQHFGVKIDAIVDFVRDLPNRMLDTFKKGMEWLGQNGGKILTWYKDGLTYAKGYVERGVTWVVAHLPEVFAAVIKNILIPSVRGIFKGVAKWFEPKEPKDLKDGPVPSAVTISTADNNKVIAEANKAAANLGLPAISNASDITVDEIYNDSDDINDATQEQKDTASKVQENYNTAKKKDQRVQAIIDAKKNAYLGKRVSDAGNVVDYYDSDLMVKDEAGNTMLVDENGNIVNSNDATSGTSTAGRIGKGVSRMILTGNKGVVGGALRYGGKAVSYGGKVINSTGKLISKVPGFGSKVVGGYTRLQGTAATATGKALEAAGNLWDDIPTLTNATEKTATITAKGTSLVTKLIDKVSSGLSALLNFGPIKKYVAKCLKNSGEEITEDFVKNKITGLVRSICDKLTQAVGNRVKNAASAVADIANAIAKFAWVIDVAFTAADFISGWNNAESILGVVNQATSFEVTWIHRLLCGLLKVLNGRFLLGIIPESTIADCLIDTVLPFFNHDTSELQKAREDSLNYISEVNAKDGTNYSSVEAYNKRDSLWTKIKTGAKELFTPKTDYTGYSYDVDSNTGTIDLSGLGSGKSKAKNTTYGTGRAYQKDPRVANIPFNRSGDSSRQTIGDSGCGPVAAVNAVNYAYGTGNDIITAANAAKSYKELDGGTRPEFFDKYFKDNGLKANRLSGSSIEDSLKSGNPVVLMGKDSKGGLSTPYGPNPHYITAKGIDRNGNIIVDDPENPVGTAIYNKNRVLSHSSIAIGASKYGSGKYGRGRDHIGYYVAEFESGTAGSAMISSGAGDYGGVSFGTYQFPSMKQAHTTSGSLPEFWNKYYASSYPGVVPGDNEPFKNAWKSAVAANPDQFLNNELSFMYGQYYNPIRSYLMSGIGLDPDKQSRGFQELAWAMAVQFGPKSAANKIIAALGSNWNSMSQEDMIRTVSNYIASNVATFFRSSSAKVQQSAANRYNNRQLNKLLPLANQKALDSTNVASGGTVSDTNTAFVDNNYSTGVNNSTTSSSNSKMGQLGEAFSKLFRNALAAEYGDTALGSIFGSSASFGTGSGNRSKYGMGWNDYRITAIWSKKGNRKHTIDKLVPKALVLVHNKYVNPQDHKNDYTVEGEFGFLGNITKGYISRDTAIKYDLMPAEDNPGPGVADIKRDDYQKIATEVVTAGEKNTAGFIALGWIDKPYESMVMKGAESIAALNIIAKKMGVSVPITDGKKTVRTIYKQYFGIDMDKLKDFADKIAPYANSSLQDLQNKESGLYSQLKTYAKAVGLDIGTRKNFESMNVQQVCASIGLALTGESVQGAVYASKDTVFSGDMSTNMNSVYGGETYNTQANTNQNTGSIFDIIKSAFFNAFNYTDEETGEQKNLLSLFGLWNDGSSGSSGSYSTGSDSNGYCAAYGGIAPAGLSEAQKNVYQKITSIIGKNHYTQSSSREQVGASLNGAASGYGDCSSTVRWALRTGAGVDPGSYTGEQITNEAGKWVDGPYEVGSTTPPNANALAVGDLMFYGKPSSSYPRHVSHVEMYYGNNKRIGHGDGIGPTVSDYTSKGSTQTYLGAKRFIEVGGDTTLAQADTTATSDTGMASANVAKGYIASPFNDPTRESHNGVDIAAPKGEPVVSNVNGEVIRSEYNETNGNMVVIRDGQGRLHTFEHLLSPGPKVGTRISVGSVIGYVGSTGRSSGNHVHVSVTDKNGQFVDPISKKPSTNTRPIGGSEGIDYTTLIKAIIEVLVTIADNTSKVDTLIKLLTGLNTNTDNTASATPQTTSPSNDSNIKAKLNRVLGSSGYNDIVKSNDVSNIIEMMSKIALD